MGMSEGRRPPYAPWMAMRRSGRPHDRIEQICRGPWDDRSLRGEVVRELALHLPFDAHVWLLTDPSTRVGVSPVATVPGLPWSRLPELTRLRYLTSASRWTVLQEEGRPVSSVAGHGAADAWSSMLGDFGVVDVATVVFADRFGCWGWLDLWRTTPRLRFTGKELDLLAAVRTTVTTALRRSQAATFHQEPADDEPFGPAVLVLGPELDVRTQTHGASTHLARINPPDPSAASPVGAIPAAAYNVAAQLLAREQGIDTAPARARVHLGRGRWVTVKADRMAPVDHDPAHIAVSMEETTATDRCDLFSRSHAMTAREDEVLRLLVAGADTRAVAAELFLSEHTVNDHVKAVLAKSGLTGRQALLARVAGASAPLRPPRPPG